MKSHLNWLIAILSLVTIVNAKTFSKSGILMDVYENDKILSDTKEVWDLFIYPEKDMFNLNVASFIYDDKEQEWHVFNWHHEAISIKVIDVNTYEAITDFRMNLSPLKITVKLDANNKLFELNAKAQSNEANSSTMSFRLNKKIKTLNVGKIYNSAYSYE